MNKELDVYSSDRTGPTSSQTFSQRMNTRETLRKINISLSLLTKSVSKRLAVSSLLLVTIFILTWPNFLLLWIAFDLNLLIYTSVIFLFSGTACYIYFKNGLTDSLIATASIIFAVLFFTASAAQDDLSRISMLTGVTQYNCNVAHSIMMTKNSLGIDYSMYRIDEFIQNTGFAHDKFHGKSDTAVAQVIYDMTFSNRLSDHIVQMNTPKDADTNAVALLADAKQIQLLAVDISRRMNCNSR